MGELKSPGKMNKAKAKEKAEKLKTSNLNNSQYEQISKRVIGANFTDEETPTSMNNSYWDIQGYENEIKGNKGSINKKSSMMSKFIKNPFKKSKSGTEQIEIKK